MKTTTKKAKKSANSRRTIARFLKLLGACAVPAAFLTHKDPKRAWAAATYYQRAWAGRAVCATTARVAPCWCGTGDAKFETAKVFAAFRKFKRTGKVV